MVAFSGDTVALVGEASDAACLQALGRPSLNVSPRCQRLLADSFHCVLRLRLPGWPFVMDELTVWQRRGG